MFILLTEVGLIIVIVGNKAECSPYVFTNSNSAFLSEAQFEIGYLLSVKIVIKKWKTIKTDEF